MSARLASRLLGKPRGRVIRPGLSVEDFFRRLHEREVDYVVLRWFEDLPHVEPGRDIDLLIADEDISRTADLFAYWPVGQKVDAYSVTGRPGYAYAPGFLRPTAPHEMAVFPPHLARRILDGAEMRVGGIRVPNERDHFFALAYHAAYLKGERSGLRSRSDPEQAPRPASHDYATILAERAAALGIDLPAAPTVEDLDDMLAAHGWRPAVDVLERVAVWSPWVKRRHFPPEAAAPDPPGLAMFFLRERAVAEGMTDEIIRLIEARGFEALSVQPLDAAAREAVVRAIRGGNWDRGPYPVSGGPPACAVIALDVLPREVPASVARDYPLLQNLRIVQAKNVIRRLLNERLPRNLRFNAVHSTDNDRQAWEAIRLVAGEQAEEIAATARARIGAFNVLPPGVRDLTAHGNRSRVELIPWEGGHAVRKTFKPHCLRFLHREVAVLRTMAHSPRVPKLLEVGESHYVIEELQNAWGGNVPKRLPLDIVRQVADFVRDCAAHGYDPVDLTPRNLMVDAHGALKVIDFEFYHPRPPGFPADRAYALVGVPRDFPGDIPVGSPHIFRPAREWFPCTGLGVHGFLHRRRVVQYGLRAFNFPRIAVEEILRTLVLPILHAPRLRRVAVRIVTRVSRPARRRGPREAPGTVQPTLAEGDLPTLPAPAGRRLAGAPWSRASLALPPAGERKAAPAEARLVVARGRGPGEAEMLREVRT